MKVLYAYNILFHILLSSVVQAAHFLHKLPPLHPTTGQLLYIGFIMLPALKTVSF